MLIIRRLTHSFRNKNSNKAGAKDEAEAVPDLQTVPVERYASPQHNILQSQNFQRRHLPSCIVLCGRDIRLHLTTLFMHRWRSTAFRGAKGHNIDRVISAVSKLV